VTLIVDQAWVTASALLWVRLGVLFFMTPVLSGFSGPPSVLVLLSLGLSGLLCAAMPHAAAAPAPSDLGHFVVAAILEAGLGALLAFGVHAAFAAFGLAGQILDLQIGFGAGQVFDPVTRRDTPVIGAIMSSFAAVAFFAVDGHHAFLRGIAFSAQQMPPGAVDLHLAPAAVVRQFGATFSLAVAMAAPVMFTLLLIEAALAVLSRVLPQMNVYFVGLPLKLLVGLLTLSLSATTLAPVMRRAFASIFQFWDEVLR
jgi:flagellar biosynthetic protein FliR